jgi:hypothetical protein
MVVHRLFLILSLFASVGYLIGQDLYTTVGGYLTGTIVVLLFDFYYYALHKN